MNALQQKALIMSVLAIVVLAIFAVLILLFAGGLVTARRRATSLAGEYKQHLDEADRALERARAADKGWDRALLEDAAHKALAAELPDWGYAKIDLVLVEDPPGITEDRAHFVASGESGDRRLILARRDGGWVLDQLA